MNKGTKLYVKISGQPILTLKDDLATIVKNMPTSEQLNEHIKSQNVLFTTNKKHEFEPIIVGLTPESWGAMYAELGKKGITKQHFVDIILASNSPTLVRFMPGARPVEKTTEKTLEQLKEIIEPKNKRHARKKIQSSPADKEEDSGDNPEVVAEIKPKPRKPRAKKADNKQD